LLITYFLFPSIFQDEISLSLLILGTFLILLAYLRYILFLSPLIRVIQHSLLFFGLAALIVAIDVYYKSALFITLLIPVWALFLLVRLKLSSLNH
jgi:hypothetical protein